MVAHAGLGEQHIADEKIALVEGTSVGGQGRAGDGEIAVQGLHQGLGDRADVAARRRIERRAVFEQILPAALLLEPLERGEGLRHRIAGRDGPGLERNDAGLAVGRLPGPGHADELHRRHAALGERVGEVARPRKIVGDAAKEHNSSRSGRRARRRYGPG